MRIIFFSEDTRIRTREDLHFKRTVYLLRDHLNVTAVVSTCPIFSRIYIDFFVRTIFFG